MNKPLVSVCVPVYNGELYLKACIDSILAQTFDNIEIIISDDNSYDKTSDIIRRYIEKNNRIKLFSNSINLGLVGNWNRCIELATGEWIKFLFQDDMLHPKCIETMVELIPDNCKMIVCDRQFVFEDDSSEKIRKEYCSKLITLHKILQINKPMFLNPEKIIKVVSRFPNINFIGEPTAVMFKKTLFYEIGGFNPLLAQACDLEYWFRIVTNFGLFYIPETLASFRVHGRAMTASNRNARMNLADLIALCFDLLKSDHYRNFRRHLSKWRAIFITEVFKFRIYEIELFVRNNPDNVKLIKHYEAIKNAHPDILVYKVPSLTTKLLWVFVGLRRKLKY